MDAQLNKIAPNAGCWNEVELQISEYTVYLVGITVQEAVQVLERSLELAPHREYMSEDVYFTQPQQSELSKYDTIRIRRYIQSSSSKDVVDVIHCRTKSEEKHMVYGVEQSIYVEYINQSSNPYGAFIEASHSLLVNGYSPDFIIQKSRLAWQISPERLSDGTLNASRTLAMLDVIQDARSLDTGNCVIDAFPATIVFEFESSPRDFENQKHLLERILNSLTEAGATLIRKDERKISSMRGCGNG